MKDKLASRKLWAMIASAVLNVLNSNLNLMTPDSMNSINTLISIYLGGQSIVDATSNFKSDKKE